MRYSQNQTTATRLAALALGLALATTATAQRLPKPEDVVQVRVEPARVEARAGGQATFTLVATIREGFHVNSHQPLQEYLIPTRVELLTTELFALEKVDYPKGELKSFGFSPDEKLSVYDGTLRLPIALRVKDGARNPAAGGAGDTHTVRVAFHYQACNDEICLRPTKREAQLTVRLR
ncbi:MAG: protein-disulfide reductase DsbD domain-containing protein [Candidatus Acidiferrales bacterium]|nr:hypothetical protein [Acidobacteriota bacterium]